MIVKIEDLRLVSAVKNNLRGNPHQEYVYYVVNSLFSDKPSYLVGGSVRDPIVQHFYGTSVMTKDFDILIDDSENPLSLENYFCKLSNITPTSHGGIKWRPKKGVEIDVIPFSNSKSFKEKKILKPSLEGFLKSCDFTTSSIAYGFNQEAIFNYLALEAIQQKQVELSVISDPPHRILARLILHSEKMRFSIGPKGHQYILTEYNPSLDFRIKKHLEYHDNGNKFEFVIKALREITK